MINRASFLSGVPNGLKDPLLAEYDLILQAYLEAKWTPTELSGGKFCEIVYTILHGHSSGSYASSPSKPNNFVDACKRLEQNSGVPRSFQILIPRILPALYEVRNNRGVGHVGGDVDPNFMDSTFVVSTARWVMAELTRVFHMLTPDEAQKAVDGLATTVIPIVWHNGPIRRVLNPNASMLDHILLLASSSPAFITYNELKNAIEPKTESYLKRSIRKLHKDRFLEFDEATGRIMVLPPGASYVASLISKSR